LRPSLHAAGAERENHDNTENQGNEFFHALTPYKFDILLYNVPRCVSTNLTEKSQWSTTAAPPLWIARRKAHSFIDFALALG
jgi:hypothetical protein